MDIFEHLTRRGFVALTGFVLVAVRRARSAGSGIWIPIAGCVASVVTFRRTFGMSGSDGITHSRQKEIL